MGEPTTTTAMRGTAEIKAEVAELRERASRLNDEANKRTEKDMSQIGAARDEAAAEAWGLRQKAKAADIQAQREHKEAMAANERAQKAEADATKLEADYRPSAARDAREIADEQRAVAKSHTQRAKDAEQRSVDATNEAEPLEQKVKDLESGKHADPQPTEMQLISDQLEQKAMYLEEAEAYRKMALDFRESGRQQDAVELANDAVQAQARADAINPDYSGLDDAAKAAIGIPVPTEIEMDPEDMRPGSSTGQQTPDGQTPVESPKDGEPTGAQEPNEIEMPPEDMRPGAPTGEKTPDESPKEPTPTDPERPTGEEKPAPAPEDPERPTGEEKPAPAPEDPERPTGEEKPAPTPEDPEKPTVEDGEPSVDPRSKVDSDRDGLPDLDELALGTNLLNADTDGDGLTDGFEAGRGYRGLDPLQADADKDDVNDGEELLLGTDPLNPNTDGDQYDDGKDLMPLDPNNTFGGGPIPAGHSASDDKFVLPESLRREVVGDPNSDSLVGDDRYDSQAAPAADGNLYQEPVHESAPMSETGNAYVDGEAYIPPAADADPLSSTGSAIPEPAFDSYDTASDYTAEPAESSTEGSSDEATYEYEA